MPIKKSDIKRCIMLAFAIVALPLVSFSAEGPNKISIAGIYPHLSMWNSEGECGTGAVVPWAGKLWVITYGPHVVFNSDDKLYSIDENMDRTVCRESLGGTHANRMIHEPSEQLAIGCYLVDKNGKVRAIPRGKMPGRLTGTARSQTDDKNKIYFATMEEGLYEVDVNTLDVKEIIRDGNLKPHPDNADFSKPVISSLHGYHGKGFYAGFGKLFYSNNGVHHKNVDKDPTLKSGALASWTPGDRDWSPIRISQFTEITGKYGIKGSDEPDKSPIWSLGFDAKSVILMLCDNGQWSSFRLPKASHSYDGSHGWNTEWPRIRDVGAKKLLMTMHGAFWDFPPEFDSKNIEGIRMKSNYLKVVGDFCEWNGKIVLGCDDSAQKEFFNKRPMKAETCSPEKSNSNLVFLDPKALGELGPAIGRGSVFLREDLKKGAVSDPMLVGGFKNRILSLSCSDEKTVRTKVSSYSQNSNECSEQIVEVSKTSPKFLELPRDGSEWVKIELLDDAHKFTAHFNLSNGDERGTSASSIFNGIARIEDGADNAALMRSTSDKTLAVMALERDGKGGFREMGTYSLDTNLKLKKTPISPERSAALRASMIKPKGVSFDNGSVLVVEDGKRYRLPLDKRFEKASPFARVAREVATERDLFNCGGTFYELPARNAQGMAKIRPIASHSFDVFDYASFCGLIFISGMSNSAAESPSGRTIISDDGKLSLWAGSIDELWKLGKPVGEGYVWKNHAAARGEISDPLLLTGYDKKTLRILSKTDAKIAVEIDVDGTGIWVEYCTVDAKAGKLLEKVMDKNFAGYWVRFRALDESPSITASMLYQ